MQKNDYEQLYYDLLYENKKLKEEIEILEEIIKVNGKDINLKKFIIKLVKSRKDEDKKLD